MDNTGAMEAGVCAVFGWGVWNERIHNHSRVRTAVSQRCTVQYSCIACTHTARSKCNVQDGSRSECGVSRVSMCVGSIRAVGPSGAETALLSRAAPRMRAHKHSSLAASLLSPSHNDFLARLSFDSAVFRLSQLRMVGHFDSQLVHIGNESWIVIGSMAGHVDTVHRSV